MILVGTIGQLIFKKYLDENKINYEYQFQAGKYDDFDFEIDGKICEIKTSGYSSSFFKLNLLYSQDQNEAGLLKGFKYCVQIFIDGFDFTTRMVDMSNTTVATIVGHIEFDRIAQYKNPHKKYYGDDYKVPISELKDIRNILSPRF